MLKINLIRQVGNGSYLDCFDEIETSLLNTQSCVTTVFQSRDTKLKSLFIRYFVQTGHFIRAFYKNKGNISLSLLMGASFGSIVPHVFGFKKNFIYMYDAWPRFHKIIAHVANSLNINLIFFSSSHVTETFNAMNLGVKGVWIPEGINLQEYSYAPFKSKKIDVLEFGRKYDLYHDKISGSLNENNYTHLFEKNKGEIVFKSRSEFLDGLSKAKISICIPSNITHPERSEGISSMTLRYLQSMASKCLIVGILPEEMRQLFDYIPIVEIDMNDPSGQILEILSNYESYIPLIEKNYLEIEGSHTWDVRIEKMLQIIKNESGS